MSDLVLDVQGIGKQYNRAVSLQPEYRTLKETIEHTVKGWMGKSTGIDAKQEKFWALQDITFQLRRGEVLGIIGRNGSGKTTLLKIITRLTHPTTGNLTVHGSIGSYLGIGVGLHQELSGRENIFVSGTMLGMTKKEIDRKLEEIIAFAELEEFIDMPMKYYSSGMQSRLAFSVAAHLEERDILIIDEALAAGDLAFIQKCFRKIGEMVKKGQTAIYTSHYPDQITMLSTRCLYLQQGKVVEEGNPHALTQRYLRDIGIKK